MPNWKLEGVAVIEDADAVATPKAEGYDPADYTVEDVKAYVEDNPDERDAVLEAERGGKDRVTLVEWLES